jgi:hypothetical protein
MGVALEVLTGFIANLATLTNATMNGTDSLTVRYSDPAKKIWLLHIGMMADALAAGTLMELKSPKLHDNVHGIRLRHSGTVVPLTELVEGMPQRLYAQDTLSWQLAGNSGAGSINPGWMLLYYEDLQGIAARLIDVPTLKARYVETFTVETQLTGAATGAYSAGVAANANFDFFKPNTDYALVGYTVDRACSSVHLRGADSGNLRVGGPGAVHLPHATAEWFPRLATAFGIPLIPVFNSAAKQGIFADVVTDHNAGTFNVTWIFGELSPKA